MKLENIINKKSYKPGFETLQPPSADKNIGVRYMSGCRDGNYNKNNLNGRVALKKEDDSSDTLHVLKAVSCAGMATILFHRMKKAGNGKVECLRTVEEIKQEREKVDLTTHWEKTYPAIREIIESKHIGKYLFKLHNKARGKPTCMLICTGCHVLALRIREKQKDGIRYTVIETYNPNNTFFYRIVLEKTDSIQELDYTMLFGTDHADMGIIFCQTSMDVRYQADMLTIINSLTKAEESILKCLPQHTHGNITYLDGSRLYYALYVINKRERRKRDEHLHLINKITESKGLWDTIEKSIRRKTIKSISYYDILTVLCARDLLIKECCSKYNQEITPLTSTTDTDTLEKHEEALKSGIFCAGQLGIFKTPYAILCVIVNRMGTDTLLKCFLVAATYLIIINTILLPIEISAVKQLHHKTTAHDILPVAANSIFAAFFIPILFYAFEKHMQGKMPYSNILRNELLRAIETKQAENKSGQAGSESGTMEEPLLISVPANDIDNNPNTQDTSHFSTKDDRSGDLNPQPYNTSICRIM